MWYQYRYYNKVELELGTAATQSHEVVVWRKINWRRHEVRSSAESISTELKASDQLKNGAYNVSMAGQLHSSGGQDLSKAINLCGNSFVNLT